MKMATVGGAIAAQAMPLRRPRDGAVGSHDVDGEEARAAAQMGRSCGYAKGRQRGWGGAVRRGGSAE